MTQTSIEKPTNTEDLVFSNNFNNKLDCKAFTTFRMHNPRKYMSGKNLNIVLKDEYLGKALILEVKTIKLADVNRYISYIDTGYDRDEFVKMVMTMYKNMVSDFKTQDWDFILLLKIDK